MKKYKLRGLLSKIRFNHKQSIAKVPVINRLNPEDMFDFVLVVVRKNQVADLLPVLAQNKSPNIVFMGNNLSGPAEFAKIIDKQRIMLGTVVAGGKRDGNIIRAIVLTSLASVPFGEVDGTITPRLKRLIKTLRGAGIKAKVSHEMIDHQMTHAVGVALIGTLTMKYHCDLKSLARSREDMKLFVDARREAHQVLRALGHKIVPRSEDSVRTTPRFLQIAAMSWLLKSKFGEVGLAYHVSQAPDEVQAASKRTPHPGGPGRSSCPCDQANLGSRRNRRTCSMKGESDCYFPSPWATAIRILKIRLLRRIFVCPQGDTLYTDNPLLRGLFSTATAHSPCFKLMRDL